LEQADKHVTMTRAACLTNLPFLLKISLFSIDGCKMPSNTVKEWSGTFKELDEKRDKLKRPIRRHLREHHERD
jgi:hypothetical protein